MLRNALDFEVHERKGREDRLKNRLDYKKDNIYMTEWRNAASEISRNTK